MLAIHSIDVGALNLNHLLYTSLKAALIPLHQFLLLDAVLLLNGDLVGQARQLDIDFKTPQKK